jgi:hypothetical protein
MVGWLLNGEFGRTYKEAAVAYLRLYPGIFLDGLRKTTMISIGTDVFPVQIRTEHTKYKSTNLLVVCPIMVCEPSSSYHRKQKGNPVPQASSSCLQPCQADGEHGVQITTHNTQQKTCCCYLLHIKIVYLRAGIYWHCDLLQNTAYIYILIYSGCRLLYEVPIRRIQVHRKNDVYFNQRFGFCYCFFASHGLDACAMEMIT